MHAADFSHDRRYRYWLEARLSDDAGVCLFVMLNPSTADEFQSDPTVTRAKGFARSWGYGTLWVCNIFALRSTDPKALRQPGDPIGEENDHHILKSAREADRIVCAWGNHGEHLDRGDETVRMLRKAGLSGKMRHLGMTKLNQPKHPLYLRADTQPIAWGDDEVTQATIAEISLSLLDEAERHFEDDDLYKACEKGLEAVNHYLRTIGEQRGWATESRRDLHDISLDLAFETDDPYEAISRKLALEGGLAIKFYGSHHTDWLVEDGLGDARKWISLMESRSKPPLKVRESQLDRERQARQRQKSKERLKNWRKSRGGRPLMERYLNGYNNKT